MEFLLWLSFHIPALFFLSLSGVITHNNYHRAANRKHGFLIPLSDTGTTKAECIGVQNWMSTGPYQRQVTQN